MNNDPTSTSIGGPTPPQALTGQMLKHFRLESRLGEGGMGLVYRAFDTRLHRQVALKLLSSALTHDPELKQRFLQEARAAARISHPAIAQTFDADEDGSVTFIVMELVEGKTVRQLVQDKELDLLGAIDIGIQVAEGLTKAHELGIVHRDIKPANIIRTVDGHVKILDFGLAKLLPARVGQGPLSTRKLEELQHAQTQTGIVMGTPAYMSPEQVRGLAVDGRTDIFALGVLLFEMATGQAPFQRENSMDSLHATAFEETPSMRSIRPHIPEGLQRVVSRCLRKQPGDRYSEARVLAEDLRRIRLDTEAGLMRKPSWPQRIQDAWDELRHLRPSHYVWYGIGLVAALWALYLSLSKIGSGGVILLVLASLYIYRHVRNRSHAVQERFVRRVSKIPEVVLIVLRGHQATVVVDRAVRSSTGESATISGPATGSSTLANR
jgi:serine/threonine protein kinase